MPPQKQLDTTPSSQKQAMDENAADLRKKSDRRKNAEKKGTVMRRKDETEDRKRPVRPSRRRSMGNHPAEAATELVSPIPVASRESKSPRLRKSTRSSSRIRGDLMSPRSVKQEGGPSSSAHALAPSSRDSPRRSRCTKTAEASLLSSPSIKMRERRSSLPSAASIRSPFKRSRERRPSFSSGTCTNTVSKLDPEVAQIHNVSGKDDLNKIAPTRRMNRRRTIAIGRVETDSSSEEQPIIISKPKLNSKKVGIKEGSSEKMRMHRRASGTGASEPAGKGAESFGRNLRSKSTRHSSTKSLGVSAQQPKPSGRRSRCSSMQHVTAQSAEGLKNLSGEAFRQAFVSVTQKGVSPPERVNSNVMAKGVRVEGRSPSSASKSASPRKSKTSNEKRLKPPSNEFDDDDASLNILKDVGTDPDADNAEGFFAVRSFIYEQ